MPVQNGSEWAPASSTSAILAALEPWIIVKWFPDTETMPVLAGSKACHEDGGIFGKTRIVFPGYLRGRYKCILCRLRLKAAKYFVCAAIGVFAGSHPIS